MAWVKRSPVVDVGDTAFGALTEEGQEGAYTEEGEFGAYTEADFLDPWTKISQQVED